MELHVPVKDVPLTALAVIASSAQLQESVKLIPGKETTLLLNNNKTRLVGTATVTRYLIRVARLLNEQLPETQREARLIDIILVSPPDLVQKLIEGRQHKYLLSDVPSLADTLAWAVTRHPYTADLVVTQHALTLAEQVQADAAPAAVTSIPELEGTSPSTNVMDRFKNLIAAQLSSLSGVDAKLVYDALDLPRSLEHGDLAVAIPRLRVKGNPAALAAEWAAAFVTSDHILEAKAIGPFLNFRINPRILVRETIGMVSRLTTDYGKNKLGNGKTVIVEFSSPNIAKPFHAGHLRSTIIGSFLRNVYEANGWNTIAMNYLGDWGKQYGKVVSQVYM